jgi:lipoprotein-anchoring transpeptidase ErfK/SrfK
MQAPSVTNRILTILAAVVLFALSATLAWAVVSDFQAHGLVPTGVTVAGQDLSGLSEQQARAAIESAVSAPMLRPVTVTGDEQTWTLDPTSYVAIDVDAMIEEAYSTKRSATLVNRLDSQLRGTPLPNEVEPVYSVDEPAVAAWVARTAAEIDRKPKNATRKIVKYKFKIKHEEYGAKLEQTASAQTIVEALSAEAALSDADRAVALTVTPIKPKKLAKDFKTAIIVSLSQCRIRLYKGDKLVKTYRCAPGRLPYHTPTGDFTINRKARYAPWINPGSAWAASMPAIIPGGPGNPMGTTKIGINYPGVFMHGVPPSEYSSIGRPASHGCMRMMPSDVLDLYGRVKVGNPVYIRP